MEGFPWTGSPVGFRTLGVMEQIELKNIDHTPVRSPALLRLARSLVCQETLTPTHLTTYMPARHNLPLATASNICDSQATPSHTKQPPPPLTHLAVNPYGSMNSGSRSVIISISSGVVPRCTNVAPVSRTAPSGNSPKASQVSLLALESAWSGGRVGPHPAR